MNSSSVSSIIFFNSQAQAAEAAAASNSIARQEGLDYKYKPIRNKEGKYILEAVVDYRGTSVIYLI